MKKDARRKQSCRRKRVLCFDKLEDRRLLAIDLEDATVFDTEKQTPPQYVEAAGKLVTVVSTRDLGSELHFLDPLALQAQPIDFNPGKAGSDPRILGVVGSNVFFVGTNIEDGTKLRFFDASDAVPLIQTVDATPTLGAYVESRIVAVGNKHFFAGFDPVYGHEVAWFDITDPTLTPHWLDISSNGDSFAKNLYVAGGKVFFNATDQPHGNALRVIEEAATQPVVRTVTQLANSHAGATGFVAASDKLYFQWQHGISYQLSWLDLDDTNYTPHGVPGVRGTPSFTPTYGLKAEGDTVFVGGDLGNAGYELLWFDASLASPSVNGIDLEPGSGGSALAKSGPMVVNDGKLFFEATTSTHGREVRWLEISNPSVVHTIDSVPGATDGLVPGTIDRPTFVSADHKIYFQSRNQEGAALLSWVDTTNPSLGHHEIDVKNDGAVTVVADRLFFHDTLGDRFWLDNTSQNPQPVRWSIPNSVGSRGAGADEITVADGRVFFVTQSLAFGREVAWADAGSATPEVHVVDLAPGEDWSHPENIIAVGNDLYFSALERGSGRELYHVDLSKDPVTPQLIDIAPGYLGSFPGRFGGFVVVNNKLYFGAEDITHGLELRWIDLSDENHEVQVLDIREGRLGSSLGEYGGFTVIGDNLFFTANTPTHGAEPMWIDTKLDTPVLHVIDAGPHSSGSLSQQNNFAAVGKDFYFSAGRRVHRFSTDTLELETLDLYGGAARNVAQGGFQLVGDRLYFSATAPDIGTELHWINLTQENLSFDFLDVLPGHLGAFQNFDEGGRFAAIGSRLFFNARLNLASADLTLNWLDTLDSVPAIRPVSRTGYEFKAVDEKLVYFSFSEGATKAQLFWLDGTKELPIATPTPFFPDGYPGRFSPSAANGSDFLFEANIASYGTELVRLDTRNLEATLQAQPAEISEKGGQTTVTLVHNSAVESDVVFAVTTNGPGAIQVPATVTVPAGSSSTTFMVTAIDNALFSGDRSVGLVATTDGMDPGRVELTVVEDELLSLGIEFANETIAEGASTQVTVSRNSEDISTELVVSLVTDDPSEVSVPASVIIPAGQATVSFEVLGKVDRVVDGTQVAPLRASAPTFITAIGQLSVTDIDAPTLAMVIAKDSISERNGTSNVVVTRNTAPADALVVNLTSGDTTEIFAPETVTFAAGAVSATFAITALDDAIVDGTQTVELTAAVTGYESASDAVDVTDDDSPLLTLVIVDESIGESGGATQATVTRNTDSTATLAVQLSSSDTTEASVPTTVVIPAGEMSATFSVSAVDDSLVDGDHAATISAMAAGHTGASRSVVVVDDETPHLSVVIAASAIAENRGSQVTVTRNTPTTDALVVTLGSSDPGEAKVPTEVVIPAGSASAAFNVTGVQDHLVDGTQAVSITVVAEGHSTGTAGVDILDIDTPRLQLILDKTEMPEMGGSATGTLVRNTDPSVALLVTLVSSDTSEMSVAPTVTIAAGATSTTFTISSVDDAIVDGTQVVTLTASAPNHPARAATIRVTDEDTPVLAFTVGTLSIDEGSTGSLTITRNTDTTASLNVALDSDDKSEVTVPSTVTIPSGSRQVSFLFSGVPDNFVDGLQAVSITGAVNSFSTASASISVVDIDAPSLAITLDQDSISENGGFATATVTRNTPALAALTVALTSLDNTEIVAPETVTIPAGDASVSFQVSAVDDMLVDGDQRVSIEAESNGFATGKSSVEVLDADTAMLSLVVSSQSIDEDGIAQATVLRNTLPDRSLVVSLNPSDRTELQVPWSVTIPAGSQSATFEIAGKLDGLVDGTQTATIHANAASHSSATGIVDVTDVDTAMLQLDIVAPSIDESGGSTRAFVRRNTSTSSPLVVALYNDNPTEANVPASVTIPGGAESVEFTIAAIDDIVADGTTTVTVAASSADHSSSSDAVLVFDDDSPGLTIVFDNTAIDENGGTAQVIVRRNSDPSSQLLISLTSDNPRLVVPSQVVIAAGSTEAAFSVAAVNNAIVDGDATIRITAMADGHNDGIGDIVVSDDDRPTITLVLDKESISERGGTATGLVSHNTDTGHPLVLAIMSSDETEATAPRSVVIPAGQSSVQFTIDAVDDAFVDPEQSVTFTASAAGYSEGQDVLTVTDDDVATLTLLFEEEAVDEGASLSGTIHRNTPHSQPLTVILSVGDGGEASVPAHVTIAAGEQYATFTLLALTDGFVDGPQSVAILATGSNHREASQLVTVGDIDVPTLSMELSSNSIIENASETLATLSRNTPNDEELVVALTHDGLNDLTVPGSVTIPAGKLSVQFTIVPNDNRLVDGLRERTITVAANGFVGADATLAIKDDDVPELDIVWDANQLSEAGGAATATIHRNTAPVEALIVQLSIDDVTEILIPANVTIPAGQMTTSFVVNGVDDLLVDGTQRVGIVALASEHLRAETVIDVLDDDLAALQLSLQADSMSENGGRTMATVRRNTPTLAPLQIAITSSSSSLVTPSKVTIPAGSNTVQFVVAASNDSLASGDQEATISVSAQSHLMDHAVVTIVDDDPAAVGFQWDRESISEAGTSVLATFSRNTPTSDPLTISIAYSDALQLVGPQSVAIPAGEQFTTVSFTPVDNMIVDGDRVISVGISAAGHLDASEAITILDDDTPRLALETAQLSIAENGGTASLTLQRNTATERELLVTIGAAAGVSAPASVLIPAGSDTVTFEVAGIDNSIVDGQKTVTVSALAASHIAAEIQLRIEDDDQPMLALGLPEVVRESDGTITATLRRNTLPLTDLMVSLSTDSSDSVSVPQFVKIPAGEQLLTFTIDAIDDNITEPDSVVHVYATASGFAQVASEFVLIDDDIWTWTNPEDRLDVNGDAFVSPIDVLLVVNYLNSTRPPKLPELTNAADAFYDVNKDGFVSPVDALIVINHLSAAVGGEGESTSKFSDSSLGFTDERRDRTITNELDLLAVDGEFERYGRSGKI